MRTDFCYLPWIKQAILIEWTQQSFFFTDDSSKHCQKEDTSLALLNATIFPPQFTTRRQPQSESPDTVITDYQPSSSTAFLLTDYQPLLVLLSYWLIINLYLYYFPTDWLSTFIFYYFPTDWLSTFNFCYFPTDWLSTFTCTTFLLTDYQPLTSTTFLLTDYQPLTSTTFHSFYYFSQTGTFVLVVESK